MISFKLARKVPARTELHGVPVSADELEQQSGELDWSVLQSRGFEAKPGQVMITGGANGHPVAAVGVGRPADVTTSTLRRSAAGLARAARRHKRISTSLLDAAPDEIDKAAAARAVAEGLVLGSYSYGEFKSDPKRNDITSVSVVGTGGQKVTAALDEGAAVAAGVCLARDLVNEPGGSLTPVKLAQRARAMARAQGLSCKVMDAAAIKRAKFGGLLGVNRGSTQQPRFVELSYAPEGRAAGSVALVGKGVTFDAGGLDIKTAAGMQTMKCDMGGAAAVIGAMSALPAVAPRVKVTAYLPMTDNMLGGDATRPGDVLRIRNGKTVEVLNTDAEGRLILADALVLAGEAKHDAVVDIATLTGASVVALGQKIGGVMGNDEALVGQVLDGAERAGELVWRLPLPKEYRKQLDSNVADLKNIGSAHGGALTAGLFLQEFIADGLPWAHIDIAGPAFTDADDGETTRGGTGFGVRTLVELIRNFEKPAT